MRMLQVQADKYPSDIRIKTSPVSFQTFAIVYVELADVGLWPAASSRCYFGFAMVLQIDAVVIPSPLGC